MTPDNRDVVYEAAQVSGAASVSDYVTTTLVGAARRTIEEHRTTQVPAAEWDAFIAALDSPDYSRLDALVTTKTLWDQDTAR